MAQSKRRKQATPEEVRALAHPLRLRIIRLLYDGPLSNKELTDRLGENPATVLHHVRTLVSTGFLVLDSERPAARGRSEKLYRSTGKSWQLDIDAGLPGAGQVEHATVAAFASELAEAGDEADLVSTRLALVISPARRAELKQRIYDVLDEFALQDDPDGEPWALLFALHRRPAARPKRPTR